MVRYNETPEYHLPHFQQALASLSPTQEVRWLIIAISNTMMVVGTITAVQLLLGADAIFGLIGIICITRVALSVAVVIHDLRVVFESFHDDAMTPGVIVDETYIANSRWFSVCFLPEVLIAAIVTISFVLIRAAISAILSLR